MLKQKNNEVTLEFLKTLDRSIIVASINDPDKPEYPPFSPIFPATPTKEIEIEGRKILIKDESFNSTGTHKDRMAWEVVVFYKKLIRKELSNPPPYCLPSASIISSGSAAFAIQSMLRLFGLPSLRVLYDEIRIDKRIILRLESIGCKLFPYDLSSRILAPEEVLKLTKNEGGININSLSLSQGIMYYDWLAYEILNLSCTDIFVPVGTGDLFRCILTTLRDEVFGLSNDRRLLIGENGILNVNVFGATSRDPKTSMSKLYAQYRPSFAGFDALIKLPQSPEYLRKHGKTAFGSDTGIYEVEEEYVKKALRIARYNMIRTEESGIAGLALFLKKIDRKELQLSHDSKVLVVNTGWMYLPVTTL